MWPQRPGFATGSIYVGNMIDEVALGQVFLRVFRSSPVNVITLWFFIFIYHLGWTMGPLVAAVQRHSLAPSTWKQQKKQRISCCDRVTKWRVLDKINWYKHVSLRSLRLSEVCLFYFTVSSFMLCTVCRSSSCACDILWRIKYIVLFLVFEYTRNSSDIGLTNFKFKEF
jgi:hypothetical protein